MDDFLRFIILLHIILGFGAFFILAPLALFARKGGTRHRYYGSMYCLFIAGFYVLAQLSATCHFLLNQITLYAFIRYSFLDTLGVVPVVIAYMAVCYPDAVAWRKTITRILLVVSILVTVQQFHKGIRHGFPISGLLILALAAREIYLEKRGTPLKGITLHIYYMMGAFAYAMIFQSISMYRPFYPLAVKWLMAFIACLPALYVLMAKLQPVAAIPKRLTYCLILSYAVGLFSSLQYHNLMMVCPRKTAKDSPSCQIAIDIGKSFDPKAGK